jgi:hypothetical protein
MRAVYQAEHLIDAHLVRGRLQSEGIEAWVRGEWLTGALGELPLQGLLAVCVRDADQAAALELLAEWRAEAALREDDADPDDAGSGPAFLA